MSTLLPSNTFLKSMAVNMPRACLAGVSEGMAPLEQKFFLGFFTNSSHHSLFLPDIRNHNKPQGSPQRQQWTVLVVKEPNRDTKCLSATMPVIELQCVKGREEWFSHRGC